MFILRCSIPAVLQAQPGTKNAVDVTAVIKHVSPTLCHDGMHDYVMRYAFTF